MSESEERIEALRCWIESANWAVGRCEGESTGRASRRICNRGGMATVWLGDLPVMLRREVAAMKKFG